LEDARAECRLLAGFGHTFTPEDLLSTYTLWRKFSAAWPRASWSQWSFAYRHGEVWAVGLLRRLVELAAAADTTLETVSVAVEAAFEEASAAA